MKFRPIDERFWKPAKLFLRNKGPYTANAILWLGTDPTWHSMGFEHFAVSCLTDPALVEEIPERVTRWTTEAARGLCALGFDFIWAVSTRSWRARCYRRCRCMTWLSPSAT